MTAFESYKQSEFNYAEARHGKGLEGLLKRYFKQYINFSKAWNIPSLCFLVKNAIKNKNFI